MECSRCHNPRLKPRDFQLGTSRKNVNYQRWCRRCRRRAYMVKKYGDPPPTCSTCSEIGPVWQNGQCRKCNEKQGLRQCRTCNTLLPTALSFYGHQRVCISCKSGLDTKSKV